MATYVINVQFTGTRLVLFWFPPEGGIREQLTWKTSIIKRRSGKEQRQAHMVAPRQTLDMRVVAENDTEAAQLRNILMALRSFLFGIPIWWEQRQVTAPASSGQPTIEVNTVDCDFRTGSSVMVFEPATREVSDHQIDSFDASSITLASNLSAAVSAQALVMPVRFGHITREPQFNDAIVDHIETQVTFETEDNVSLAFADQSALEAEFTTHSDGLPILSDPNFMDSDRQQRTVEQRIQRSDSGFGVPFVRGLEDLSNLGQSPKVTHLRSLAEIRKWRSLLHWLEGSWGEFYLPTFRNDLPASADFQLDASTVRIHDTGHATYLGNNPPHTLVMLELPDGRQFFAPVTSMATVAGGFEDVNLGGGGFDSSSSETVPADDARISWCELVRIDGDVATFVHRFAGVATLMTSTKTLQ